MFLDVDSPIDAESEIIAMKERLCPVIRRFELLDVVFLDAEPRLDFWTPCDKIHHGRQIMVDAEFRQTIVEREFIEWKRVEVQIFVLQFNWPCCLPLFLESLSGCDLYQELVLGRVIQPRLPIIVSREILFAQSGQLTIGKQSAMVNEQIFRVTHPKSRVLGFRLYHREWFTFNTQDQVRTTDSHCNLALGTFHAVHSCLVAKPALVIAQ